jgi:peptidyl-prolyl cis-trans isomerase SurA
LALLPTVLWGQQIAIPTGLVDERVDRIVAIVGDSVIFHTDLEEQLIRIQARGTPLPSEASARDALRRELLEGLINQQLILQAAARDTTISVSDDRVESTLRLAWDEEIRRWGTEAVLRDELQRSQGLTVAQYRAQLREEIRRDILIQSYLQARRREARPVAVDEQDIQAFFEEQQSQLARRPATVTFRQIFVEPRPGEATMAPAREEIERIMGLLDEGQDFSSLARQFSQDPGSRTQGGDLGWYRRGAGLVREFEDAAFRLREGQRIGPVETQFGAHLIEVERIRGAERRIRHILISADVSEADQAEAQREAEEVRARLAEGAPVRSFTDRQRASGIPDSLEVAVEQLRQLPEVLSRALIGGVSGDLVGPVEFPLGGGPPAWAIFQVIQTRPEGEYTLEDLRPQIRERLQQEKLEERLIENLRARSYVDIRI